MPLSVELMQKIHLKIFNQAQEQSQFAIYHQVSEQGLMVQYFKDVK
jgi:hypothetical protein